MILIDMDMKKSVILCVAAIAATCVLSSCWFPSTADSFAICSPDGLQRIELKVEMVDNHVWEHDFESDATSDSGLPVYYYVKYGPAEIHGNMLKFKEIPPRSKFPIEVSVVAWQYGIYGRFRTAEPVERIFRLLHGAATALP